MSKQLFNKNNILRMLTACADEYRQAKEVCEEVRTVLQQKEKQVKDVIGLP